MARTNKYASVNFNEIYEKKLSNTSNNPVANSNNPINTSSLINGRSKTMLSNSRIQGNMLVLTRPTPKPISIPLQEPSKQENSKLPSSPKDQVENISLRPQGRTGTGTGPSVVSGSGSSLKTNKFVPPHLRPGFVGREEKPVGPGGRVGVNRDNRQGICDPYPGVYGENGRPKSGGGYEKMMRGGVNISYGRGGGGDPGYGSRGTRPNSSG